MLIIAIAIIFRINPILTISNTLIFPVPKIIALGGVATGNIKAHDADNTAGIINHTGVISSTFAVERRIGITSWVVAVFDVNSVNKFIPAETDKISTGKDTDFKPCNCSAI